MLSDTRTNAGVDHISTYGKMYAFEVPGERSMTLLGAGNLAVTQSVVNWLQEGVEIDDVTETLATVPSMFRAAQLVGAAVRHVYDRDGRGMATHKVPFDVSLILGGQIGKGDVHLYEVYCAGNFIQATPDTPYLQIGEHKYGKPILDRVITFDTSLEDGVKAVLISMDSTIRSNLTVGLPIDLAVYRRDALAVELRRRITEEDAYFKDVRERWSAALRDSYRAIAAPDWL
jgi:putative proteasome-type protease